MADPACGSEADSASPGWGDVRQAVMTAAEACACAVTSLGLRGEGGGPAAGTAGQAVAVLRDLAGRLRPLAFDEAVIEAERARAADEALAAAGLVPPPRGRHLRAIS